MPLVKTAPQPQETPIPAQTPTPTGIASFEWEGIPIDVLRMFNEDMAKIPTKNIEQLRDITAWAKSKCADEPSIGNILQTISKVQRELGSPAVNEKAYAKVWQFIKIQKAIDDLRNRQESLRGSRWL